MLNNLLKKHLLLLIGVGIVLRILVLLFSPPIGDITNAYRSGMQFLLTKSVYGEVLYPYPPPVIWYNAFTLYVSEVFQFKFLYVNKLLSLGCDILTIIVLYKTLKKKEHVLLYVFNPIVILVSCAFGKEEPYIILLAVLGYLAFQNGKARKSSLFLSLSIAIKFFTVLLLPLFIFRLKQLDKKIIFFAIAIAPVLLLMSPFIFWNPSSVSANVASYSGVVDYGWLSILKALTAIIGNTSINFSPLTQLLGPILSLNKYVFLMGYVLFLSKIHKNKKTLLEEIILVFLIFYILYGGIGTNYLYWIIPFLIYLKPRQAILYTVFGTFAIAGYVATQFYEPVLKYTPFPLFQTPFYLNIFYLVALLFFYLYIIKLFVNMYQGKLK